MNYIFVDVATNPAGIYLFKVNNGNTATICEICLNMSLNEWSFWEYFHSNHSSHFPANIYLFKVNNRKARKRCEICPKLTNDVNDVVLVFLLLTLNIFHI